MIEIDGSYGEGGGSIVRMASVFSAISRKPFRIYNIRAKRPRPGLAAQHLKAVETVAGLCSGETEGLKTGAVEFEFHPGEIRGGEFRVDIGTAGSITLVLQCIMPVAMKADRKSVFTISGGTDVAWAPTIDYLRYVTLPVLRDNGYNGEIQLVKRGYYPVGGGIVNAFISPSRLGKMELKASEEKVIQGISHCTNLPEHIPARQARASSKLLEKHGLKPEIRIENAKDGGAGSGITLWSNGKGGSALGERGKTAEKVGEEAALALIAELKSSAHVDVHLADQLIPYLALSGGSYTARELSMHARTNIWVAEQFLDIKIETEKAADLFKISC